MPRNEVIEFKVTAEEKEQIRSEAKRRGLTTGGFVRAAGLHELSEKESAQVSRAETPIPHELPHEKAFKAKVRRAVENEEAIEVKVEPGTAKPTTADVVAPVVKKAISEQELRVKAMDLVRVKGITFRAALVEVRRDG